MSLVAFTSIKAQTYCGVTYSVACSSGDYIESVSTTGGATNISNLMS